MAAAASDPSAIELRELLARLLGEHAFLLMETMRAASLGQGEEAVLAAALDENAQDLRDGITLVYGDEAGAGFGELWDQHVDALLAYADGRRRNDTSAIEAARADLDGFTEEFAAVLAQLNPRLRPADEEAALAIHVEQLTAFADGDFERAYASQRAAFGHMFELGDHLSLEMTRQYPDRFTGGVVAFSPRSDLRLTLDRLLAEHLVLAAETMRAGVATSADFDAGAQAIEANSADLESAIGSLYGEDAGGQFGDVWRLHVDAYLEYVQALGQDDEQARTASLAQLHAYHEQIAAFLASANPNLREEDVARLIQLHVQALISQAEATKAGDHARAIGTTRDAYAAMFDVGAALADAIAKQFPDRFRDLAALPATATVDAAAPSDPSARVATWAALLLLVAVGLRVLASVPRWRTAANRRR